MREADTQTMPWAFSHVHHRCLPIGCVEVVCHSYCTFLCLSWMGMIRPTESWMTLSGGTRTASSGVSEPRRASDPRESARLSRYTVSTPIVKDLACTPSEVTGDLSEDSASPAAAWSYRRGNLRSHRDRSIESSPLPTPFAHVSMCQDSSSSSLPSSLSHSDGNDRQNPSVGGESTPPPRTCSAASRLLSVETALSIL